jgi:hypothetical protein
MTKRQILTRLKAQTDEAGGIRAWSRAHAFSASFISDVLGGNVAPSKRLLLILGYEAVKEVRYRRIGETEPEAAEAAA